MALNAASQALVADMLLCATNEGKMYDEFLSVALVTRRLPRGDYGDAAAKWLKVASEYLPFYYRTTDQRADPVEVLVFAAELADYYTDHFAEFDEAQINALMARVLAPAG